MTLDEAIARLNDKHNHTLVFNPKQLAGLLTELKDELSGWQDDPFSIIAEVCETNTDCKNCLWFEKCPFKDYGEYPNDWRKG